MQLICPLASSYLFPADKHDYFDSKGAQHIIEQNHTVTSFSNASTFTNYNCKQLSAISTHRDIRKTFILVSWGHSSEKGPHGDFDLNYMQPLKTESLCNCKHSMPAISKHREMHVAAIQLLVYFGTCGKMQHPSRKFSF